MTVGCTTGSHPPYPDRKREAPHCFEVRRDGRVTRQPTAMAVDRDASGELRYATVEWSGSRLRCWCSSSCGAGLIQPQEAQDQHQPRQRRRRQRHHRRSVGRTE